MERGRSPIGSSCETNGGPSQLVPHIATGGTVLDLIQRFHRDQRGATATEYVILLILVACFIIFIVKTFGKTLSSKFDAANLYIGKYVYY
jgi:Flp pilus assembly pilin Flp